MSKISRSRYLFNKKETSNINNYNNYDNEIEYYFNLQNYNNIKDLILNWLDYISSLLKYSLKEYSNKQDNIFFLNSYILKNIIMVKNFEKLTQKTSNIEEIEKEYLNNKNIKDTVNSLIVYNKQIQAEIKNNKELERKILNKKGKYSKNFNNVITYFYDILVVYYILKQKYKTDEQSEFYKRIKELEENNLIIKKEELTTILSSLILYFLKNYKRHFETENKFLELFNEIILEIFYDFNNKKMWIAKWNYKSYISIRVKNIIKEKIKEEKKEQQITVLGDEELISLNKIEEIAVEWPDKNYMLKVKMINNYKEEMGVILDKLKKNNEKTDISFTFFKDNKENKEALIKVVEKYTEYLLWLETLNQEEIVEIQEIKEKTLTKITKMWVRKVKEAIKIIFLKLIKWNSVRIKKVELPVLLKNF